MVSWNERIVYEEKVKHCTHKRLSQVSWNEMLHFLQKILNQIKQKNYNRQDCCKEILGIPRQIRITNQIREEYEN